MNQVKTISQFFEQSNTHFRIFDMGRRIRKMPSVQFQQFEECTLAYPKPSQRQAWLGVLGWENENKNNHFIWFLKLPLDEKACMVPAGRDDFLHRLLKTVDAKFSGTQQDAKNAMDDNPYGFTPNQERMACFHAKTLKVLGQPASQYYQLAQSYFAGRLGYEQWPQLGLQGIADIATRFDEDNNAQHLAKSIPHLPAQPFSVLCNFLENEKINTQITEAIVHRINEQLMNKEPDIQVITSGLRGISYAKAGGLREQLIKNLLNHSMAHNIEVLITIAGRTWSDLHSPQLNQPYIEALASESVGQDIFNHVMSDLLYIPGMRGSLLQVLRNPERSKQVEKATGAMFGM